MITYEIFKHILKPQRIELEPTKQIFLREIISSVLKKKIKVTFLKRLSKETLDLGLFRRISFWEFEAKDLDLTQKSLLGTSIV